MTVGSIFEGFRLGAPNLVGSIRNLVAIILALFSIYSAFFGVFSDMLQRGFHLALVVLLIFSASMVDWRQSDWKKLFVDSALMFVGFGVLIYHVVFFDAVASRWGELTDLELWLGILCIVTLLEATRRSIGWPIVILALVFLSVQW